MNSFISPAKANRLFWLARYVERVFISLVAINKYIDSDIDGAANAYKEFCTKVSIPNNYTDPKDFRKKILYDKNDPASIHSMLLNAFDNGIELREDITSESLSYIHLALQVMDKCAAKNSKIFDLHPIADYMMSFWGSIDENVITLTKMNILRLGRRLESIDMNVRLLTDWDYINELLKGGVLTNLTMLPSITDKSAATKLKELIESHDGKNNGEDSVEIIDCIGKIFKAEL